MRLSKRNRATLDAAARVLIPSGGAIEAGAVELGIGRVAAEDVDSWPPHVRVRVRGFLTGFEWLPLASGYRRPFSRLAPSDQETFLTATYRHPQAARRLAITLIKQLCYTAYLQTPEVEQAVGYDYACLKRRKGVEAGGQHHH